jgi:hypothetical protein
MSPSTADRLGRMVLSIRLRRISCAGRSDPTGVQRPRSPPSTIPDRRDGVGQIGFAAASSPVRNRRRDRAHWAGDDLGPGSSPGAGSRRRWVDGHVVRWRRHGVSPGRRRRRRRLGPPSAARRSGPDCDGGPRCSGIR